MTEDYENEQFCEEFQREAEIANLTSSAHNILSFSGRDPAQNVGDTRDRDYTEDCLSGCYVCYSERTKMKECHKWYNVCELQDVLDELKFMNFSIQEERTKGLTNLRKIVKRSLFSETKRFPFRDSYVNASSGDWPEKFGQVVTALNYKDNKTDVAKTDKDLVRVEMQRFNDSLKAFHTGLARIEDQIYNGDGIFTQRQFEVDEGLTWDPKCKKEPGNGDNKPPKTSCDGFSYKTASEILPFKGKDAYFIYENLQTDTPIITDANKVYYLCEFPSFESPTACLAGEDNSFILYRKDHTVWKCWFTKPYKMTWRILHAWRNGEGVSLPKPNC